MYVADTISVTAAINNVTGIKIIPNNQLFELMNAHVIADETYVAVQDIANIRIACKTCLIDSICLFIYITNFAVSFFKV